MSKIVEENRAFVFYDDNENKKVLFEFNKYLANMSRISVSDESGRETAKVFLEALSKQHESIFSNSAEDEKKLYFVIDSVFLSYITKFSTPIKVLQVGGSDGKLSYHITEILGKVNPKSLFCLVNDEVDNENRNVWLDTISMAETKPELSIVISDYDKTHLQNDYFDIAVINGSALLENPYQVIKEIERIIKKTGIIICYSNNKMLENALKLIFDDVEKYCISSQESVLTVNYNGKSWTADLDENWKEEMEEFIKQMKKLFENYPEIQICKEYISNIKKYLKLAMNNNDVGLKKYLIDLRQNLLDYTLNFSNEYKEFYYKEINKMLN